MRQLLFVLVIFAYGCSQTERQSESSLSTDSIDNSASPDLTDNRRSIIGNDIWVRDEPVVGEVVMKLNEGDKFEILSRGHFEIIAGNPNYWYNIKHNGKEGWLFGSQSDIELPVSYAGGTLKEAWGNMRNQKKNDCEAEPASKEGEEYQCEWNDLVGDNFSIREVVESWEEHTYTFLPDTIQNLWLQPVRVQIGAAELSTTHKTLVGFKSDRWRLYEIIDGAKAKKISVDDNRDIYLFLSDRRTAMWGEQKIYCWLHDKKNNTFQKRQLIKGIELWDLPNLENEVQTDSIMAIKLNKESGQVKLGLEFSVSDDEGFTWDLKSNQFVPDK